MLSHDRSLPEVSDPGAAVAYVAPEPTLDVPAGDTRGSVVTEYTRPLDVALDPLSPACERSDAESRWRVAYGALDLARLVSGAPRAALLACAGDGLSLLATRGVGQEHLDAAHAVWAQTDSDLAQGRLHAHRHPPFVALPCVNGFVIVGVLLLAWESERVQAASALTSLGRVLGASLRRLGVTGGVLAAPEAGPGAAVKRSAPAPRTPAWGQRALVTLPSPPGVQAVDIHGLVLYVLLEQHEWNVARVARVLGVTRMTVYNRMRAAGIARVRVRKSARRGHGRPPAPGGPAAFASPPPTPAPGDKPSAYE
jgi:hypothetical protein